MKEVKHLINKFCHKSINRALPENKLISNTAIYMCMKINSFYTDISNSIYYDLRKYEKK